MTRSAHARRLALLTGALLSFGPLTPAHAVATGTTVTGTVTSTARAVATPVLETRAADGTWTLAAQGTMTGSSSFEIDGVPAAADYRLCFLGTLGDPVGCDRADWPEASPVLAVGDAAVSVTATVPTTALDTLSGTVRRPSGASASGAVVTVQRQVSDGVWQSVYNNVPGTTNDGRFGFDVVPGSYRVRVSPSPTTTDAAGVVLDGVASTASVPISLPAGADLSGRVSLTGGGPADGVDVRAVDATGVTVERTQTDTDGGYTLHRVPVAGAGPTVRFAWKDDNTSLQADSVANVHGGATLDRVLRVGSTFSGTVLDADAPAPDSEVRAVDPTGVRPTRIANPTSDGGFVLGGLTPGAAYRVVIDPEDGRSPRYLRSSGDVTVDASAAAPFTAGAVIGVVDLNGLSGTVPAPGAATIAGSPAVGATLRADVAGWTAGRTPEEVLYTWYSGGTQVTTTSTTGTSYTISPADVGQAISVQITGRLAGYRSARIRPSAGIVPAPPAPPPVPVVLTVTRGPAVSGRAKVGQRLSVDPGAASPTAGMTLQWLRNGVPIARATGTTYRLAKADKGRRISVKVTYLWPGRGSTIRTSSATPPVKK